MVWGQNEARRASWGEGGGLGDGGRRYGLEVGAYVLLLLGCGYGGDTGKGDLVPALRVADSPAVYREEGWKGNEGGMESLSCFSGSRMGATGRQQETVLFQ